MVIDVSVMMNYLRKPIQTVHRFDSNRLKVWKFIRDEIAIGRQIYIVYPLIQESEKWISRI
jgi:ATP-dependent DNA helicase RecG